MRIGLMGKMASGKSTLATRIMQHYPNMKKLSLAGPVKEIANNLFNMKDKDRILLQQIGTKMREIDQDVWVDTLLRKINDYDDIIVDDVRFENEINKLKHAGFKIFYLDIDESTQDKYLKETYTNDYATHMQCRAHESEQAHTLKHMADKIIRYDCDLSSILMLYSNDINSGCPSD
tara:strand:+ start:939 stop:1466 length:528 start_codon:yes stop_codon:yes gene_type:complete